MSAYLFVHFREKSTPDGEQVYFGLSRDGFHWESVNGGQPVLWAYYGAKGVRDFAVCRCKATGKFCIVATDLSLAYGMRGEFHHSWDAISRRGSKQLALWESEDLIHWSEQRLISVGIPEFGCMWAPDIVYDRRQNDYLLHWSSSHSSDDYQRKAIYCCRTRDFKTFSAPALLYAKEDSGVIDSAMAEENGVYYLFVKSEANPEKVIMLRSDCITGPFERMPAFEESMSVCAPGLYEAPAITQLDDGRWLLLIDYYGVRGAGQGYVPFVSEDIASGRFTPFTSAREDHSGVVDRPKESYAAFSFPYGFKHGSILPITQEEYERIHSHNFRCDT